VYLKIICTSFVSYSQLTCPVVDNDMIFLMTWSAHRNGGTLRIVGVCRDSVRMFYLFLEWR